MSAKSEYGLRAHTLAFIAILVLTVCAYAISGWVLTGPQALVFALCLAGTSALLVVLVLMNLAKLGASNYVMMFTAVALVATLILVISLDVTTRHTFPPRPMLPEGEAQLLP